MMVIETASAALRVEDSVEADPPLSASGEGAGVSSPDLPQTSMRVTKRNGGSEPVDVNKIVRAVSRCCVGLPDVDPMRVATRTISGLYDGATTRELDQLSIQTAAAHIAEEPQYAKLAARLLSTYIDKEVRNQEIHAFSQSIAAGRALGLINDRLSGFVTANARKLNDAIDPERSNEFEYFGLRTLYDRYLLRHPQTRLVIETPQQFFMRIACALGETVPEALELYDLLSSLQYMPSSPTLFNAGATHEQLSSCFLLDSPQDTLESIYSRYADIAMLSKFSGGIGIAYHRVRSRGSLIAGTNGHSNGIVPWLKTLDASVAAVNQGGKRKGAACVYLEPWHADVEEFLELRDNTGDAARRTHNLNLAMWVPDLFMRRVQEDGLWSLFDPKAVPDLPDLYGPAFEQAYAAAETVGLAVKTVKARELYGRMMRTLAQTGNGWMTFKDRCNLTSNQTGAPGRVVHSSNLCTEIVEVTQEGETAVCNLGSINLGRHTRRGADGSVSFDFEKLARTVRTAVRQLDRVIDLTFYPIGPAQASNSRWRPVGLGLMGLQDVFFQMRMPFDSPQARELSKRISEAVYFHSLSTSCDLAVEKGAHAAFPETRAARGELQFDAWEGVTPTPEGVGNARDEGDSETKPAPSGAGKESRWDALRARIQRDGLRNSLLIAIAPTATIASICGCYECIEPQVSNLFKRETLSGDFLQVNRYLVAELKALGLWNEATRNRLKQAEGSIQGLTELPEELRLIYRTAWELPMAGLIDMAADRGAFIDQSQSLNLFMESPNIGQLSSMYFYAWKKGLKTTYYLRSRPATRIAQTTVGYEEQGTGNTEQADRHGVTAEPAASIPSPPAQRPEAPEGGRGQGEGFSPPTVASAQVAQPPEAMHEGLSQGRVLREPQDERIQWKEPQDERVLGHDAHGESNQEPAAAPSTPVARPLTLFDIPVFAIDPPSTTPSPPTGFSDEEAVACSLENPEYCEACQ